MAYPILQILFYLSLTLFPTADEITYSKGDRSLSWKKSGEMFELSLDSSQWRIQGDASVIETMTGKTWFLPGELHCDSLTDIISNHDWKIPVQLCSEDVILEKRKEGFLFIFYGDSATISVK